MNANQFVRVLIYTQSMSMELDTRSSQKPHPLAVQIALDTIQNAFVTEEKQEPKKGEKAQ